MKSKRCIYCGTRYTGPSVMDGPYATSENDAYCSHECVGAELADMDR
ncbi:hypothetical protein [Microbispora sp. ATCC PTA-5024]|nr:hypothetical protein [Microbispora sp. ATCC PTA-5024]ETK36100.1 hypothetical protein MPTA5024_10775 [Microbispora sp. ATCC PTA-5024]